jgi:hypothetical protein
MTVKVPRVKRFEAVKAALADRDAGTMGYILADPLKHLPPVPDVAALRGPGWAAIARGAALPVSSGSPSPTGAMTPPAHHTEPAGEPAVPPPLAIGAEVPYAGMVGKVAMADDGPPPTYIVAFPNGARVLLTDRDLGRA